jgi:hypothetical protein
MGCATFGQHGSNPHRSQRLAMRGRIIAAIPLHTVGAVFGPPRLAPYRRDGGQQWQQWRHVMAMRSRHQRRQRNAMRIGEDMMFTPTFPAIRRIGPRFFSPPTARRLRLSTTARVQSILSASCSLARSRVCTWCQTPAWCQSRKRRQQVIPEPQPISCGSISHGSPACSTKSIPVNAARSGTRGRPPLALGGSGGNNGAMSAQSASGTSGFAMYP